MLWTVGGLEGVDGGVSSRMGGIYNVLSDRGELGGRVTTGACGVGGGECPRDAAEISGT